MLHGALNPLVGNICQHIPKGKHGLSIETAHVTHSDCAPVSRICADLSSVAFGASP